MPSIRLLLPELRHCAASAEVAGGVLAGWIARGDVRPDAEAGTAAALRSLVEWPGTALPAAALTRSLDAADAAHGAWLRADPCYVRPDLTTVRLLASGDLGQTAAETAALLQELKPLFGDSGVPIDAPTPARWYLAGSPGTDFPDCPPPEEILGDDIKLHWPQGAAGKRWRLLLNEAQVVLHNHPVNAARIARGAVPINSLWFWGGGRLPGGVSSRCARVITADPVLVALTRLAGGAEAPFDPAGLEDASRAAGSRDLGIDLRSARAGVLERDWLQPLDARLRRGDCEAIELGFVSGQRVTVRASHRRRFWRRVRPLPP
ncbi:MAG TPA: phosphoglycerate mutase [Dokdonella sp.]|uniref:phosphoglycerate mutase n=1 Tax=Dokdonella sp. TaxID=2291710 RepID=UPI002CAB41AC|nr:phosphoglycerate mutase [Dokdonella sp.]HUD43341.1 phosphoglycerate mutase [Dokdonella sp.]